MRPALLFLLLLLANAGLRATECVDRYFNWPHLELRFCQNGNNYHETRVRLYQGRSEMLNRYIESLIAKGRLSDKKFIVEIDDQILTYPRLELTWNDTGHHVYVSGFPDLQLLANYVLYFTQAKKTPVRFDWNRYNVPNLDNEKSIDSLNRSLKKADISALRKEKRCVWKQDEAELIYTNERVYYTLNGKKIPVRANAGTPVKADELWLFVQKDSAFVYKNGVRTVSFAIPKEDEMYEDYGVGIRNGRVDFCWGGCPSNWPNLMGNVMFYYSRSENRFYVNPKEKRSYK